MSPVLADQDRLQQLEMLRSSAAGFAARESPPSRARALRAKPPGFDRRLWNAMATQGWTGLLAPESLGGYGLGLAEMAEVAAALAAQAAPEPVTPVIVFAGRLLQACAANEIAQRLLTELAEGRTLPAVAWQEDPTGAASFARGGSLAEPATVCVRNGDDCSLRGGKRHVRPGAAADGYIVSATSADGVVLVYHNTFWTGAGNVNTMDLISPVKNSTMRNNIFQSSGFAIRETLTGSTGNDWNYDNWYTTNTTRFKWENVDYSSIAQLCTSTGLECNGHESIPGLNNPTAGDFSLAPSSPNIDRGIAIPGINDAFAGRAPDIGAYESAVIDPPPVVTSIANTDQNPTSAGVVNFVVTFSEPVTGVDLAAPFGDFALAASPEIIGASVAGVGASEALFIHWGESYCPESVLQICHWSDNFIMVIGNFFGGCSWPPARLRPSFRWARNRAASFC